MKHGARNDIVGEVTDVKVDGVMGQAKIHVSGEFDMASVMTADSIAEMNLSAGDQVRVIVKAVNVLLVKDN